MTNDKEGGHTSERNYNTYHYKINKHNRLNITKNVTLSVDSSFQYWYAWTTNLLIADHGKPISHSIPK